VEVRLARDASHVLVEVRDHGPGIPEEELAMVFEPFYRVDKSRTKETGGFGLGLGLCRKIMSAHRGEIRLSNVEGGGLRVTLRFPISPTT
jgi:signal transduction histidine kinase